MRIFIDADACPKAIKEILYKAAIRTQTQLILVANRYLLVPKSPFIQIIKVASGFDIADAKIIEEISVNDIVVTADIPLANSVVAKGARAINPRGKLYTAETVKLALATRNLLTELRDNQIIRGGNAAFSKNEVQIFANQLDKLLAQKK
jgi:uncharacterized protein YaiI (UPF0178 family)